MAQQQLLQAFLGPLQSSVLPRNALQFSMFSQQSRPAL